MKTFYHSSAFGDQIYALPTIKAMGGGHLIVNYSKEQLETIQPLLESQPYIYSIQNITERGLPRDVVDLSAWRLNPRQNKAHLVNLFLNTFGFPDYDWNQGGWLEGFEEYSESNFAVVNRTLRYNDKIFDWDKEIWFLGRHSKRTYFMGLPEEYKKFDRWNHYNMTYYPTKNLLEATELIAKAKYFSGNQSSLLAIRQGLGLPYRMEQSPNHVDCNQYSHNETVINPCTRKLHLLYTSLKKLI